MEIRQGQGCAGGTGSRRGEQSDNASFGAFETSKSLT